MTVEQACKSAGKSLKTYEYYRRSDPVFKDRMDRTRLGLRGQSFIEEQTKDLSFADFRQKFLKSKTLVENIEKIKEQSSVIGAPAYVNRETSKDREDREREKAEKIKRTYPNYCKYPKMAVKGFENLIPNYCYYQSPSEYSRERKIVGLWLPYDAEVRFWDIPTLNSFVEQTWNNWHNSGKIKGMTKNELIKNFSEILPVDTVRGFD